MQPLTLNPKLQKLRQEPIQMRSNVQNTTVLGFRQHYHKASNKMHEKRNNDHMDTIKSGWSVQKNYSHYNVYYRYNTYWYKIYNN
jgi:hypothetical protein